MLEIESSEREAPATAPDRSGALHTATAPVAQVPPVALDDRPAGEAVVQVLGGGILLQAAALGENDARSGSDETVADRYSRWAGADDANVRA